MASWLTSYLDTIRSERVRSSNTHETSCLPGSETDTCRSSPSGMMWLPSTEIPGAEQLTFFAEAGHARTSLRRVKEQELPESVRAYGRNMRDSLERCGLALFSGKTHHCFALGDLESSSKIWPRWGIMLDGECSELGMSVRRTSETECGSWPTPLARDWKDSINTVPPSRMKDPGKATLGQKIAILSGTPTQPTYATPRCKGHEHYETVEERWGAEKAVRNNTLASVQAHHQCHRTSQLNPSWVEWLMGWPIGYTDLKPLETDKFQAVQPWHSIFSAKD